MSVTIASSISSSLMAITGLFIVKAIGGVDLYKWDLKKSMLLMCLVLFPILIYNNTDYSYIYTLIIYILTIITYKFVLNISFIKSAICCGIMIISIMLLDFLGSLLLVPFFSVATIRKTWYMIIISNIIFSIILLLLFYKTKLNEVIPRIVNKLENKKQTKFVLFLILTIIGMSVLLYSITSDFKLSLLFTRSFLIFIILFLLVIILFTERNSYDKLALEYDNLFENVKIFEDWIENEQFIRHEYRNQLAVLRALTNQKKIKDKIDSINDEMINIDDNFVNALSGLPNGGIKGILYYKIAVARNKKVNIDIDIGCHVDEKIKKLSDAQMSTLTKLIGVYCDNAIEAAVNTKSKIVTIEVYCLDSILNIVVSNTFNTNEDITNRNEKGVSTKGANRGKGLYFANKLLSKSTWIDQEQRIINNIYVQKLLIEIK